MTPDQYPTPETDAIFVDLASLGFKESWFPIQKLADFARSLEQRLADGRAAHAETARKLALCREAMKAIMDHYVSLVNSGDVGKWNPEEEAEVINARAALTATEPTL